MNAIPSVVAAAGFLSAYTVNRFGFRKPFCITGLVSGRMMFAIVACCLWLKFPISIGLFLAIIFIANIFGSFSGNLWLTWMSDLIPRAVRGRYFALRATVVGAAGMCINYAGGQALDRLPRQEAFWWIFTIASAMSLVSAAVLAVQPDASFQKQPGKLTAIVSSPLHDTTFRRFLAFICFWYLFAGISAPFWHVHMMTNLQMSFASIALYSIISGVLVLVIQPLWGRLVDRVGSKPTLTISYCGILCLPLLWVFATPGFLAPIWVDAVLTGIFWSGINISLSNMLFSLSEGKPLKESYFAVFSFFSGLCAFGASLLGGMFAQGLKEFHWSFGGYAFINFHILFTLTTMFRFVSLLLLRRVREPQARSTAEALRAINRSVIRLVSGQ
jgi:MFS family permease